MRKILFDEGTPKPLARRFPDGIQVSAAQDMGWGGKENGELLRLAAESSFAAMVTLDQGIEHQQNPLTLPLAVIVLASPRQDLAELGELVSSHVLPLLEQGVEKRFYRFP